MISEDTLSIGKKGRGSLAAVGYTELGEDMREVVFDGLPADMKAEANLPIAHALGDKGEDSQLLAAQLFQFARFLYPGPRRIISRPARSDMC